MSERPMAYEEVPGSRTTQQAIDQPQRERIAYEELQPGDIIQEGDEWRSECGRWQQFVLTQAKPYQVRCSLRVRRPYKISTILEIGDAIARAQKAATQLQEAATQLQDERDELRAEMDIVKGDRMNLREALAAEQRAHKVTMASGLQACSERDDACRERDKAQLAIARVKAEFNNQAEVLAEVRVDEKRLCDDLNRLRGEYLKVLVERDEARVEVARLSTELSARKPLEERVASLTEELAQAREASQQLLQTITDNADQFADHTTALVRQRDGFEAEVQRLQEVVGNLYNEPTARQVQDMLRTWATELDWSAGCFDSVGRDEIDTIQKTLVAVIERIEGLVNPEGNTDGE